jgi:hypothetical protein
MKISILFFSVVLLISWGNNKSYAGSAKQEQPNQQVALKPLSDPCAMSAKEIADIMRWKDFFDAVPNQLNSEKMKSCFYGTNLSGGVTITFMRYEVKNPDSRYLERSFTRDLESNEGGFTYEEIKGGAGDQMIYSYGKNGPNHVYKIRWRFGNQTEKMIEYRATKKQKPAVALEKLDAIVKALENL